MIHSPQIIKKGYILLRESIEDTFFSDNQYRIHSPHIINTGYILLRQSIQDTFSSDNQDKKLFAGFQYRKDDLLICRQYRNFLLRKSIEETFYSGNLYRRPSLKAVKTGKINFCSDYHYRNFLLR